MIKSIKNEFYVGDVKTKKHLIKINLALFRQKSGVEEPEDDVEVGGDQLSQVQLQRQLVVQRSGS